jgi:hypothetical protein
MRPYVLRLRLSGLNFDCGSDANAAMAYAVCINQMTGILVRPNPLSTLHRRA